MFTQLTMQATMANYKLRAGMRVVGATSGAKGTVAVSVASGTSLMLINVEGNFINNDH